MYAKRYTADGRELRINERETFINGIPYYYYSKTINGKNHQVSSPSLDKMREKAANLLKEISRSEKNTSKAETIENKRYTSDGRELLPYEYEVKNKDGHVFYRFQKYIDGKRIQKASTDLDKLRKIEAPYRNVFDIFDRADKAIKEYKETKGAKDTEVVTYDSPEFGKIRVIDEGGKALFCASDIAKASGYSNVRDAVNKQCRYVVKRDAPHPQSPSKKIKMSFISEGDVFRLITHSKLPSAEKFESWIFDEVLPLIRKHGVYVDDEVSKKSDEEKLEIIQKFEEEKQNLRERNAELEKANANLKYDNEMKRDAYDGFGTINFGQLRGMYGRSVVPYLTKSGVIKEDNQNDLWLTEEYKEKGYDTIGVKPDTGKPFMLWTPLGYCDVVYKTMLEQYGLKPIRKLMIR